MSKPYNWNADVDKQDEAARRIREIADEAGLEVIMICDEDFQNALISHSGGEEHLAVESLKKLKLTVSDSVRFKEYLRDYLMNDWTANESDAFDSVLFHKKNQ